MSAASKKEGKDTSAHPNKNNAQAFAHREEEKSMHEAPITKTNQNSQNGASYNQHKKWKDILKKPEPRERQFYRQDKRQWHHSRKAHGYRPKNNVANGKWVIKKREQEEAAKDMEEKDDKRSTEQESDNNVMTSSHWNISQRDSNDSNMPTQRTCTDQIKKKRTNLSKRAKEMIDQLFSQIYECMICQSPISQTAKIWSCIKCCAIFHLSCIEFCILAQFFSPPFFFFFFCLCLDRWAHANELKQAEVDNRLPRKGSEITRLKCPGCNYENDDYSVGEYRCYCKKSNEMSLQGDNKHYYSNGIPHSCGELCEKRSRGRKEKRTKSGNDDGSNDNTCPHPCLAICHPGPCKPCPLPAKF
ncbi:hypothetical protein RFI_31125, partial [Reticulomyxa filosa]